MPKPDKGWEDRAEARWPVPYWYIDTAMASLMILLTAVDEGLGACLVGIMSDADEDPATLVPSHTAAFKQEFGIPDEYDPIGAITVGYRAPRITPQGERVKAMRRPAKDVIHRGQWATHA